MKFLCGRPGCGRESTATLQIDAIAETVSIVDPRMSRDGVPLCARHADITTPPMGWAMNDLRSTLRVLGQPEPTASVVEATPPRVRPSSDGSGDPTDRPGRRMPSRQSITERARRETTIDDGGFGEDVSDDGSGDLGVFADLLDPIDEPVSARPDDFPVDHDTVGVIDLTDQAADRARPSRDRAADLAAPVSRPARRREPTEPEPDEPDLFPWHYEFDDEDEPAGLHATTPLLSRAFRASSGR